MPQCTCCSICCGVLTVCQIVPAIIVYVFVGRFISGAVDNAVLLDIDSEGGKKDYFTQGTFLSAEGYKEGLDETGLGGISAFVSLEGISTTCNVMMKVDEEDGDTCETAFSSLSVTFSCPQPGFRLESPDCGKFPAEVKVEKDCKTKFVFTRFNNDSTQVREEYIKVAAFQGNLGTYSESQEDIYPFRKEDNIIGRYRIQADTEMYDSWEWTAELIGNALANVNFYILLGQLLIGGVCCFFTGCIYQKSGSSAGGATGVQMAGQPMMQEML